MKNMKEIKTHIEEISKYTTAQKCLFYLGSMCRGIEGYEIDYSEETVTEILRAFKERQEMSIKDIFVRYLSEKVAKSNDPATLEFHQSFHESYSEEVDRMKWNEKQFYFVTGYTLSRKLFREKWMTEKWMTASEAEKRWGLKEGTVRAALNRRLDGQKSRGLAKKSEGVWLITEQAMREVYGEPK